MFVKVIRRLTILYFLFAAYGALLTHNFVAHDHEDKKEHTSHHQHHDNDESPLSEALSDIVHAPASTGSFIDHVTSGSYKFSQPLSFITPAQVELQTPFVPPQKFQQSFREERVISFSVSNTQLRAPPTA